MLKKSYWILAGLVFIKFLLQYLLISPEYELHRDEYLYLDQANHLAWGYASVPPFISWIAWVIKLLGNSFFWVKFFPALFGTLTMVVVWKTVEELHGNLFARILASTAVLFSPILAANILFQPNSLDIFFWTLFYYLFIKYLNSKRSEWLYMTAVALAFGILSKYNIVFLLIGFLPALLLSQHRKVLVSKHFYAATGLVVLITLPYLLWQYNNDFPAIHHTKEVAKLHLVNISRLDFIRDQFLYFLNSFFIILAAFAAFIFYTPFKKYRLFLFSFIFTISVYLLLRAKSYYAIGLYPVLIAFGSVYLAKVFKGKLYLKTASIIIVLLLSVPLLLLAFPVRSPEKIQEHLSLYKTFGLLKWQDGKDHNMPQDFADMLGWKELVSEVDSVYGKLPEKEHTLVLCDNHGEAGAINYYSSYQDISAVSFSAEYINWINLDNEIKHIILVKEAGEAAKAIEEMQSLFDEVQITGKVENSYAREYGTSIILFKNARGDINKFIAREIEAKNFH